MNTESQNLKIQPCTITPKMKYLGINLAKYVWDLICGGQCNHLNPDFEGSYMNFSMSKIHRTIHTKK